MNDFDKLQHWQRLLRSGDVLMGAISRDMAGVTLKLIAQGFEREQDPYGRPWAPKKKPDGRMILRGKTSRLRTGWHAGRVQRGLFEVLPSVGYATAHQDPRARSRPRRRMVPSRDGGIPSGWSRELTKAAVQAMRSHYTSQRFGRD